MESNSLTGGMFPNMGPSILGLEMPIHQQPPPQTQHHHSQSPHMVAFAPHEPDHHHHNPPKQGHPFGQKAKQQQQGSVSDDDDAAAYGGDDGGGDGKRKGSPWQRMKWTDNMVRLLIMAVFYIGDEGAGSETAAAGVDAAAGKKKSGGLLQKKGKWKSVSRAMMEKGFYVSPQQCEDKFNDLNKRYKRVNDILGKGIACRVVENQNLLDSMENIPPKMKDEVRKLLNSKHLFFREMCAYHNSCGGGGGGGGASGGGGGVGSHQLLPQPPHHPRMCLHTTEASSMEESKMTKGVSDDDDDEEEEEDDEDDEEEEEVVEGGGARDQHEEEGSDERSMMKRQRIGNYSSVIDKFGFEVMSVMQDGSKNMGEKKHWMMARLMQLEEQRVNYQCQMFELEKQRLKWVKFSSKKERDMERTRINMDRMRIENERMVLLLRQKEMELVDYHQHHQQQQQNHQQQQNSSNKKT